MLDDLNELRTLQQVLANGSLTGAARSLGVSLAVVSKRLATLERRTGVRLVNRTTRSLSPRRRGSVCWSRSTVRWRRSGRERNCWRPVATSRSER